MCWARTGRELFYFSLDGTMRAVSVRLSPDLVVGATTDLFSTQAYAGNPVGSWAYDVSPKGDRFLLLKEHASADASPINVVVNWFEELTRVAPR
jgi:hypothetical protein